MSLTVNSLIRVLLALIPFTGVSQNAELDAEFKDFIGGFEDVRGQLDSISIFSDLTTERQLSNTYIPETLLKRYLCRDENVCAFNEWGNVNYHYDFLLFENDSILVTTYLEIQYEGCFKTFYWFCQNPRRLLFIDFF